MRFDYIECLVQLWIVGEGVVDNLNGHYQPDSILSEQFILLQNSDLRFTNLLFLFTVGSGDEAKRPF